MGQLEGRLSRLEERRRPARPLRSEAERFSYWQARARIRCNEQTPRDVKHCRSLLALFRIQGSLAGENAERLLERIVGHAYDASGCGSKLGERSRGLIEAEFWRLVYHGWEGLEHLTGEIPDAWRDQLEAAARWRNRLTGMPVAALARWVIANRPILERGTDEEEIDAIGAQHLEPYGITPELLERAAGQDVGGLSPSAGAWLVYAPLADDFCSEWAWEVGERVRQLEEEK